MNTQINCGGDISPGLIQDTQMPLQINLDEQILQNQLNVKTDCNFSSDYRAVKIQEKLQKDRKDKIKEIQRL